MSEDSANVLLKIDRTCIYLSAVDSSEFEVLESVYAVNS